MQKKGVKFNAQQLFDSLPVQKREQISSALLDNSEKRELERYSRLEKAEISKQGLVQELETIEYEIAENDQWFISAKEKKLEITSSSLEQHTKKAEKLYSRKKLIISDLLPSVEISIQGIVSKIESEERQENYFQQKDLERLLEPIYEEKVRLHSRKVLAEFKIKEKLREEEEAQRYREYASLLSRLREEGRERSEKIAIERLKKRRDQISVLVNERQILSLVHFTPIENLESIVENGLRSRNELSGEKYIHTDEYRTDGWLNWVSASISFPNYKMFYSKQNSLKDIGGWAVVIIKKEVLWELDCKFILTNAASSGIRMFSDSRWSSAEALEDMFGNPEHRYNIPDFYTTDPQAEVMIHNEIPSHYIERIVVRNAQDENKLNHLSDIRIETYPQLFSYRNDFEHWRQFRLSAFSSKHDPDTSF